MGITYWLRVGIMIIALLGTFVAMRKLNQTPNMAPYQSATLRPTGRSQKGQTVVINLCPTRVSKVEIFEGAMKAAPSEVCTGALETQTCSDGLGSKISPVKATLLEEKMHWFHQQASGSASTRKSLDPVEVEKWFSRHCNVNAVKASPSANVHTTIKLYFVNGEPQSLLRSASGEFEFMGQAFQSSQMAQALQELINLPASK